MEALGITGMTSVRRACLWHIHAPRVVCRHLLPLKPRPSRQCRLTPLAAQDTAQPSTSKSRPQKPSRGGKDDEKPQRQPSADTERSQDAGGRRSAPRTGRPGQRQRGGRPGKDAAPGARQRGPSARAGSRERDSGSAPAGEQSGVWRVYQVVVPFAVDPGKDEIKASAPLAAAVAKRLQCRRALPVSAVSVVRKSFDSRPMIKGQRSDKRWVYVVDVDASAALTAGARLDKLQVGPGQIEVMPTTGPCDTATALTHANTHTTTHKSTQSAVAATAAAGAAAATSQSREADDGGLGGAAHTAGVAVPVARAAHPVVIIGSGPAGLFAALTLARGGVPVCVLERGQPVEQRGRDIGALLVRGLLNPDSNLCYGEGGAGTWSDGKLATKIGRNSDPVRDVLNTLVQFGAPEGILVSGKPHLGTDRLVMILKSMRSHLLQALGAQIRFGVTVEDIEVTHGRVTGVRLKDTHEIIPASAVVLAVGHSARAMYRRLHARDVSLTAKPFAVGFRIEHPQVLIDTAQYGEEHAAWVERGKGRIPVADYKLNVEVVDDTWSGPPPTPHTRTHRTRGTTHGQAPHTDTHRQGPKALAPPSGAVTDTVRDTVRDNNTDGAKGSDVPREKRVKGQLGTVEEYGGGSGRPVPPGMRGVFSFCMCPGGQIVCTSTRPEELCLNGMSFSRRNSVWANSALVCNVTPQDWQHHVAAHGVLAGVALQEEMEREAALRGGGALQAPVQRVVDFMSGQVSKGTLPTSSYRLGVKSAPLHDLYPPFVGKALQKALQRFDRTIPGFMSSEDGLLHGVETRTSAPVRIDRDPDTLESPTVQGLYPSGEGAGYAGGIVSAAVDGMRVGNAILQALVPSAAQAVTQ